MLLSRLGIVTLIQDEGQGRHPGTVAAGDSPCGNIAGIAWRNCPGVTQAVISTFVNYKRSATMDTAAKLATALGLELTPMKKPARKGR